MVGGGFSPMARGRVPGYHAALFPGDRKVRGLQKGCDAIGGTPASVARRAAESFGDPQGAAGSAPTDGLPFDGTRNDRRFVDAVRAGRDPHPTANRAGGTPLIDALLQSSPRGRQVTVGR